AIFWIYMSGTALLLARFLGRLFLLQANLKVKKGSAFSFFWVIIVDKDLPEAKTIIDHEKVHMRQWHSADIIFIELAGIINWFNPVMNLYKKEIKHIHEFIADEEAANLMQSKSDYALLLFSNTLGIDPNQLSNNFFNRSLLKRRIIMLNKTKSRRTGLWKYGFSAPLFALMLIVSAAVASSENNVLSVDSKSTTPLLDAISFPESGEIRRVLSENERSISSPEDKKPLNEVSKKAGLTPTINNAQTNFGVLGKHLQRNLKYPSSARQSNITGYVLVNFTVANNKITGVEIAKKLQDDIDNEVFRAFNLFKDTIQATDNTYSWAITFQLTGIENKGEPLSAAVLSKLSGQVIVTGYSATTSTVKLGPFQLGEVVIQDKSADKDVKDFASVEVLPEFEGGVAGWQAYISKTLKYPAEAKKNNISGRVILSFIVMQNGGISDIKVLRGIGGGADEEAVRVVKESPKWKPGIQNGKNVMVAYTMPIFFQLPAKPAEEKP
ncbi:MAG: TonB family protein, partial [Daejeonella sp.]